MTHECAVSMHFALLWLGPEQKPKPKPVSRPSPPSQPEKPSLEREFVNPKEAQ
jgi:hypothetical protein